MGKEPSLVPFPHAYWVIPGDLIAKGYPGSKNDTLAGFYGYRISRIIDLMEKGEREENGKPLPDYHSNLYLENRRHIGDITITTKPIKHGTVPPCKQ